MTEWESIGKMLGFGAGGIAFGGLILRLLVSWLKKQGAVDLNMDANSALLKNLQAESKKWQDLHEAERAEHENTKRLIMVVQAQNVILRMMLKNMGVSTEEIDLMEKQFAPGNIGGPHA